MTKTLTKITAGLSIVAGLSVATLPFAATHAADVVASVNVAVSNDTGACSVGTSTTATPAKCSGGGNSANGYTITIADKSGNNYNLSSSSADGGASGGFAPMAAAAASVTGTNTYGLKFGAAAASASGYTGAYSGTLVTAANMNSSGTGVNYVPVGATMGNIQTASPGRVDVTIALGENHDLTIASGTYRNTISITYTAK